MKIFFQYLIIINILTTIIYGIDKLLAKSHKQRISEKNLLRLTLIGGGYGAIFGMNIFRHKTKNKKFIIINNVGVVLNSVIIVSLLFYN